jgi:hypothetical protein
MMLDIPIPFGMVVYKGGERCRRGSGPLQNGTDIKELFYFGQLTSLPPEMALYPCNCRRASDPTYF